MIHDTPNEDTQQDVKESLIEIKVEQGIFEL